MKEQEQGTGNRNREQEQGTGTGNRNRNREQGTGTGNREQEQGTGTGTGNREQGTGTGNREQEQGTGQCPTGASVRWRQHGGWSLSMEHTFPLVRLVVRLGRGPGGGASPLPDLAPLLEINSNNGSDI